MFIMSTKYSNGIPIEFYFSEIKTLMLRGNVDAADGVLLIGGLGNNSEWWNWDTACSLHKKTAWSPGTGIQSSLATHGIKSISFDWGTPTTPEVVMVRMRELIKQLDCKRIAICAHSIGCRIAQRLSHEDNIPCVLIDPTPDFILQRPCLSKNIISQAWFDMLRGSEFDVSTDQAFVHYNIGDNPADDEEFEKAIIGRYPHARKHVKKTHWVYIHDPDAIVDSIIKSFA
jgi:pimeloyl-ACP methyl ester carboxylesterase